VWLSGLGVGIRHRAAAMAVRTFFIDAIESTGALVVAEGPQLLASSFLDPAVTPLAPAAPRLRRRHEP
jgi:hypothetical protein